MTRKHAERKPVPPTAPDEPKKPTTIAELLGTKSAAEQIRMFEQVDRIGRTPVFAIGLYLDPRPEPIGGFQLSIMGPDIPVSVIRHMLALATEQVNAQEVEKRIQEAPALETPEPPKE